MTDLDMTKLCAEAMEIPHYIPPDEPGTVALNGRDNYDPLHDDAQAMALLKRFKLNIGHLQNAVKVFTGFPKITDADGPDLNRAIVECVAKLQQQKKEGRS